MTTDPKPTIASPRPQSMVEPIWLSELHTRFGAQKTAELLGISAGSVTKAIKEHKTRYAIEKLSELFCKDETQLFLIRVPSSKVEAFETLATALNLHPRAIA